MKLVVGLGNPGPRYRETLHNVGFMTVDLLAQRHGATFESSPTDALTARVRGVDGGALLVKPLTFMNRSGGSVRKAIDFYQIPGEDLLVVCDDFNLPLGQLRIRAAGSDGGQNGLADVIRTMGPDFPRLRIGIGPAPPRWNPADFVLGKFTADERTEVDLQVARAADAVRMWTAEGATPTANRYNGKA